MGMESRDRQFSFVAYTSTSDPQRVSQSLRFESTWSNSELLLTSLYDVAPPS